MPYTLCPGAWSIQDLRFLYSLTFACPIFKDSVEHGLGFRGVNVLGIETFINAAFD